MIAKELFPFNPRNSPSNRVPIASNWLRIASNLFIFGFSRRFGFGVANGQKLSANGWFYSTFYSPPYQWRNRTMPLPNSCGTAALGCGSFRLRNSWHRTRFPAVVVAVRPSCRPRRTEALLGFRLASPPHEKKRRHPARRRVSSVSASYQDPSFRSGHEVIGEVSHLAISQA